MATKGIKATIDLSELVQYAGELATNLIPMTLEQVGIYLSGDMAKEAPVDTGRLQGAIELPIQSGPAEFEINIGVDYWEPVQFGSGIHGPKGKPYDIYPKNKPFLAFKVKGQWIYVAYIKDHPGRKPDPFIDRAIDGMGAHLDTIVDNVLRSLE